MTYIANLTRRSTDPKVISTGPSSASASDHLGRSLGWLSIALGCAELIAPRRITRFLGVEGSEGLVRLFGIRELSSGVVSLSTEKELGLWSRVVGDGLDLLALSTALHPGNRKQANVSRAIKAVALIGLLDLVAGQAVSAKHRRYQGEPRYYTDRSGFPQGLEKARQAARKATRAAAVAS